MRIVLSMVERSGKPRAATTRIGRNVRDLMFDRDIKQAELALSLGMTESSVSRRIRGKVDWRPGDLEIVARVLGVPIDRLFSEPTI